MTEENKIKKVLFYTSVPRLFRTTSIGHLYEIAQTYPVILLSEDLDPETKKILNDKELFPKLQEIIPVHQFTGPKRNLFFKNIYFYKLAKDVIKQYRPDIVIANDIYPFELYLTRFAKKIKAVNICLQTGLQVAETKQVALISVLMNAYFKVSTFLPFYIRLMLVKLKKYLGHFLYYWIMPLMVGQLPFRGTSSFILWKWKGCSGLRDDDYYIALSRRDYNLCIKNGILSEKVYILSHPLKRKTTKDFFKRVFFDKLKQYKKGGKVITLLLPAEKVGFRKVNLSLISKEEREKSWREIAKLISEIFSGWKIYIKPHPETKDINKKKFFFDSISDNIKVINPQEPVDKYIEIADIIIGLPLSASTTLFTASLQCPEKPILSLDFHQEVLGDVYKDFEGVEYINSKKKFIKTLELIRDNKYHKKNKQEKKIAQTLERKEFLSAVEMLNVLFYKKKFYAGNNKI